MGKSLISAVVVSHNEGHLLQRCLASLQFCDQLILVDMESTDNTKEIGRYFGAEIWDHGLVPVVEIIHHWIQTMVKHDWILIVDPDEVLDPSLQMEIPSILGGLDQTVGAIKVPWRFYFRGKPLKGTRWGGVQSKLLLAHRNRFHFTPDVHIGRKVYPEFRIYIHPPDGDNCIHHYWMVTYTQLLNKHFRYLREEGRVRYNSGARIGLIGVGKNMITSFKESFLTKKGYLDGFHGFFLSLFWSWYQTMASWRLYKYQQGKNHGDVTSVN